jgi:hypothetical protein
MEMKMSMKKLTIVIVGTSLLAAGSCGSTAQPVKPPPSSVKQARISVEGTYEELNVKQRKDGVPRYVGRVTIRRTDGSSVLLETHKKGIRPAAEIARFRGKRVIVRGDAFYKRCLAWGDGQRASIVGPCMRKIVSISVAKP